VPYDSSNDGGYWGNVGDTAEEFCEEDLGTESEVIGVEVFDDNLYVAWLEKEVDDSGLYIIDESGKRIGNLPTGLQLDIKRAELEGNPLATDYGPCDGKWMVYFGGVYRCDIDVRDGYLNS